MPKTFRFILTNELSIRLYCVCVIFTEEVNPDTYTKLSPVYFPKDNKIYYYDKAICVISEFPFFENFKLFLSEIYRLQISTNCYIPLEKHISYFIESVQIDPSNIYNAVAYEIGANVLKFHAQPIYYKNSDYLNESTLLPLISSMTVETLIYAFKCLLLEGKIIFKTRATNLLTIVVTNIAELIYPLKWPHVLIPILPEKMIDFLDAPVPFLVGINYDIDVSKFSEDILIIDLENGFPLNYPEYLDKYVNGINNGLFSNNNIFEKLESKLKTIFYNNKSYGNEINFFNYNYDNLFSNLEMIEDDIESKKISSIEFREVFFEFFVNLFKNYDKYFLFLNNNIMKSYYVNDNSSKKSNTVLGKDDDNLSFQFFNVYQLRKDFNSLDSSSFIYKMTETNLFSLFIDENITYYVIDYIDDRNKFYNNNLGFSSDYSLSGSTKPLYSKVIEHLIASIKEHGRGKHKNLLPILDPTPDKIIESVEYYNYNNNNNNNNNYIDTSPKLKTLRYNNSSRESNNNEVNNILSSQKNLSDKTINKNKYVYKFFPKLDPRKFIISTNSNNTYYVPKFVFQNNEWFYNIKKLNNKDYFKYVYLMIFEIWIQLSIMFIKSKLAFEEENIVDSIIDFILFLVDNLYNERHIISSKNLIYKLIKCMGTIRKNFDHNMKKKIDKLISMVSKDVDVTKVYNALMNGMSKNKSNIINSSERSTSGNFRRDNSTKFLVNLSNTVKDAKLPTDNLESKKKLSLFNNQVNNIHNIITNVNNVNHNINKEAYFKNNSKRNINLKSIEKNSLEIYSPEKNDSITKSNNNNSNIYGSKINFRKPNNPTFKRMSEKSLTTINFGNNNKDTNTVKSINNNKIILKSNVKDHQLFLKNGSNEKVINNDLIHKNKNSVVFSNLIKNNNSNGNYLRKNSVINEEDKIFFEMLLKSSAFVGFDYCSNCLKKINFNVKNILYILKNNNNNSNSNNFIKDINSYEPILPNPSKSSYSLTKSKIDPVALFNSSSKNNISSNNPFPLSYETLINSFKRDANYSTSVCNVCDLELNPHLYILNSMNDNPLKFEKIKLLFIGNLIKELEYVFRNKKDLYVNSNSNKSFTDNYNSNASKNLFWNIIFYFRYFGLPTFVVNKYALNNDILYQIEQCEKLFLGKKTINYSKNNNIVFNENSFLGKCSTFMNPDILKNTFKSNKSLGFSNSNNNNSSYLTVENGGSKSYLFRDWFELINYDM